MPDFHASLLREKFVINDVVPDDFTDAAPIIALSNRLKFPLTSKEGDTEVFVVRAQNMHTTARFAAQMAKDHSERGSLLVRSKPFDWNEAWEAITKGYESDYNPHRWVAVYHNGRILFEGGEGTRHTFLDVIEKCDARNKDDYEKSMEIAKDAFKQAGKLVKIDHQANVALIMKVGAKEGKCGVILRGPNKTTTFNLTAHPKGDRAVRASQCLTAAAAFLEGIQLAFMVGLIRQKVKYELISPTSEEARKGEAASKKLGRLNSAIAQFEHLLNVSYRPDRPNFAVMVEDAEEYARKMLATEIEAKIASGEIDSSDWVV